MNDTAPHPHPLDESIALYRARVDAARRSFDGALRTGGQLVAIIDHVLAQPTPPGEDGPARNEARAALQHRRDELARIATPIVEPFAALERLKFVDHWATSLLVEMVAEAARGAGALREVAKRILAYQTGEFDRWRAASKCADAPPSLAVLMDAWLDYLATVQRVANGIGA